MDNNVIDSREAFAMRSTTHKKLADRLRETTRLKNGDKPIFAANLGKLAVKIDPENPYAAVEKIIGWSILDDRWKAGAIAKRKRFFRLPSEAAPPVTGYGQYGSNGITFLRLAEAAGAILSDRQSPEVVASEQERAVRDLARGSSLLPIEAPVSEAADTARSWLEKYAARVCRKIDESNAIRELWAVQKDTPLAINAPLAIKIGQIALRFAARMFVIPEDAQYLFSQESRDRSGRYTAALEWLEEIGFNESGLPDIDYGFGSDDLGWTNVTVASLRDTYLLVQPSRHGKTTLVLSTWGDFENGPFVCDWSDDWSDETLAECELAAIRAGGGATQFSTLDLTDDIRFSVFHSEPFERRVHHHPSSGSVGPADEVPPIVGFVDVDEEFDWPDEPAFDGGWVADPDMALLLLGNRHPFYPLFDNPGSTDNLFKPGSVGAALIENLDAPDYHRFDKLLIEHCNLTASSALRFYNDLIEQADEALNRI